MNVLITGATGFAGSHLIRYVLKRHPDVDLHATRRWGSRMDRVADVRDQLTWHFCDLTDAHAVSAVVETVAPRRIFHLAAQSYVKPSWEMPSLYVDVNVRGTINLLEAVLALDEMPLIHVAGSGEEYGNVYPDETPINESQALRPVNPYAVSKVAQGLMADVYRRSYALPIVRTRAFNHMGPHRDRVFAIASWAAQIAEMERDGEVRPIEVGTLTARREYMHVEDVARAYWLALERGVPGVCYNIGVGEARPMGAYLEKLIDLSAFDYIPVEEDPTRVRPTEVPLLECDSSWFRLDTGWIPQWGWEDAVSDVLDFWRRTVRTP